MRTRSETIKITFDFLVGQPHHPSRNQCLSRSRVNDLAPTPKNVCGKHRLVHKVQVSLVCPQKFYFFSPKMVFYERGAREKK